MKPSPSVMNVIVLLIIATPLLYLAVIWNSVPAIVPLHYNYKMEPDRLAGKSQLWIPVAILAATALMSYVVMKNGHKIDPQRFKGTSPTAFRRLAIVMAVFISVLNLLIVMSSATTGHQPVKLMLPVIGLFFAVIGNYMPALKTNVWVGFRLPWILRDANIWRKTHQLAGKLWFWGGLLFTFVSLFVPVKAALPVLISLVLVMIIIPLVYSLTLLKKPNTPGL